MARANAGELRSQIMGALRAGTIHELVPFTGQSAGLVHDVAPAREIVRRIAEEAEGALRNTAVLVTDDFRSAV